MKTLNYFLTMLFIGTAFIFTACSEEEEELEQPFTQGMKAKVDGADWLADTYQIQISDVMYYGELFSLSGMTSDEKLIVIDVEYDGEGEYEFDTRNVGTYTPDQDGSLTFSSHALVLGSGNMIISEIDLVDSVASGTFEFTAFCAATGNSVVVTEGEFIDVPVKSEVDEYLPEDNYFAVNVNGAAWVPHTIWGSQSNMTHTISVSSSAQSTASVGLSLNDDITPGTYDLNFMTFPTAQYTIDDHTLTNFESGSVTITEHDTEHNWIEGTFNFTTTNGGNTYNLTDGSFGVSY